MAKRRLEEKKERKGERKGRTNWGKKGEGIRLSLGKVGRRTCGCAGAEEG